MPVEETEIIVRTDEALAVTYNPQVHGVTTAELPDGNVMLHVRPLEEVIKGEDSNL